MFKISQLHGFNARRSGGGGAGGFGAFVTRISDQTGADYTTATALTFDSEIYDHDGWHDNVTNNTRLTVPSGVAYVSVGGQVRVANNSTNGTVLMVRKNGADMSPELIFYAAADNPSVLQLYSNPVAVSPGDYLELFLQQIIDTSIDVIAAQTWFAIERRG